MGYLIAAYVMVGAALLGYALYLERRRAALARRRRDQAARG